MWGPIVEDVLNDMRFFHNEVNSSAKQVPYWYLQQEDGMTESPTGCFGFG